MRGAAGISALQRFTRGESVLFSAICSADHHVAELRFYEDSGARWCCILVTDTGRGTLAVDSEYVVRTAIKESMKQPPYSLEKLVPSPDTAVDIDAALLHSILRQAIEKEL